jgi:hypothetical protein
MQASTPSEISAKWPSKGSDATLFAPTNAMLGPQRFGEAPDWRSAHAAYDQQNRALATGHLEAIAEGTEDAEWIAGGEGDHPHRGRSEHTVEQLGRRPVLLDGDIGKAEGAAKQDVSAANVSQMRRNPVLRRQGQRGDIHLEELPRPKRRECFGSSAGELDAHCVEALANPPVGGDGSREKPFGFTICHLRFTICAEALLLYSTHARHHRS